MNAKALKQSSSLALASGLLLFGLAYAPAASATAVLGQTASANIIVDGSVVPSGTTMLSPSVLETRSNPARVLLAGGQVMELAIDSRAYLQATPWGELEVVVDDGSVVVSSDGERVQAIANQRLVFVQPEVQIAQLGVVPQAARVLPIVAVAAGGCTVNASGQCSSDGNSCATACECKKKDPATGVCEECGCKEDDGVPPPASKGLSKGAKIGIGIGAAAGAAILIEELDDDDEPPASPVN